MKRLLIPLTLMLLVGCSQPAVDACMVGIDLAIEQTFDACVAEYEDVIASLEMSIENANQMFLVADFWKARTDYLEVQLDYTEADRQYLGCLATWVGDSEPLCKSPDYPADKLSSLRDDMIQKGDALLEYTETEP